MMTFVCTKNEGRFSFGITNVSHPCKQLAPSANKKYYLRMIDNNNTDITFLLYYFLEPNRTRHNLQM